MHVRKLLGVDEIEVDAHPRRARVVGVAFAAAHGAVESRDIRRGDVVGLQGIAGALDIQVGRCGLIVDAVEGDLVESRLVFGEKQRVSALRH